MRSSHSTSTTSFVNPSSLSLPSPPSEAASPESPALDPSLITPSSSSTSTSMTGPPRKRARTDATPEERREARAHRNRIAAQNSRDRRKQQFSELENKVRILQQENEHLRTQLQIERERRDGADKDKENAELKERVKSLEQGWEAVLKALQTQGLPSSLFSTPNKDTSSSSTSSSNDSTPSQPPTTTFPVLITTPPVLPALSSLSLSTPDVLPPSMSQPNHDESTRHLARVATTAPRAVSLQRSGSSSSTKDAIEIPKEEDTHIEDWFNEVLASHDNPLDDAVTPDTSSTLGSGSSCTHAQETPTAGELMSFDFTPGSMGESGEDADMDRLLNLLPDSKDEFQVLLGSVIDEGKISELGTADESWNWDFTESSVVVV